MKARGKGLVKRGSGEGQEQRQADGAGEEGQRYKGQVGRSRNVKTVSVAVCVGERSWLVCTLAVDIRVQELRLRNTR